MEVIFSKPYTKRSAKTIDVTYGPQTLSLRLDGRWEILDGKKRLYEELDLATARKFATAILTGDQAFFDSIASGESGSPISERKPGKPHIKPDGGWIPATYESEPAFTNGHLAIVGALPKGHQTREHTTPYSLDRIIPNDYGLVQIVPIGFTRNKRGEDTVYFSNGTALRGDYYDFMTRLIPGATIWNASNTTPVVFKQNGKNVGVLMPMRTYGIPDGITALMAQAA
jgi:hypothetical protein